MASSTAITGKSLVSGASIKIMFTSDITGSNTSTVLSLTYNGTAYNVKVGKNGSLSNFVASEVSTGVYKYVQAYTTLELAFDGSQFIIIGNPVVLSSTDYTIYADGKGVVNAVASGNMNAVTSNGVADIQDYKHLVRSYNSSYNAGQTKTLTQDLANNTNYLIICRGANTSYHFIGYYFKTTFNEEIIELSKNAINVSINNNTISITSNSGFDGQTIQFRLFLLQ